MPSFSKFIELHERKLFTKDINTIADNLMAVTNRASSMIGTEKELNSVVVALEDNLRKLKLILKKHDLYDI